LPEASTTDRGTYQASQGPCCRSGSGLAGGSSGALALAVTFDQGGSGLGGYVSVEELGFAAIGIYDTPGLQDHLTGIVEATASLLNSGNLVLDARARGNTLEVLLQGQKSPITDPSRIRRDAAGEGGFDFGAGRDVDHAPSQGPG
jgi:hypothetical protein